MMHTSHDLYSMLNKHLAEIDKQIAAETEDAEKQIAVLPYPALVTVYQMKHADGSYILTDLMAAKAQVLSGMAALKAADLANQTKKGRTW